MYFKLPRGHRDKLFTSPPSGNTDSPATFDSLKNIDRYRQKNQLLCL